MLDYGLNISEYDLSMLKNRLDTLIRNQHEFLVNLTDLTIRTRLTALCAGDESSWIDWPGELFDVMRANDTFLLKSITLVDVIECRVHKAEISDSDSDSDIPEETMRVVYEP